MLDRRRFIGAAAWPILGPIQSALAAENPFEDGSSLLEAYMRLSGSHDNRLIIWWMDGVRYGVVDAVAEPLFGMKVGMFHRFFRQHDGTFKMAMFELTYYTDLESGQLLETFDNPYTGATDAVVHVRLGPEIRQQTKFGLADPAMPMVHDYRSSLGPALVQSDSVWIPTSVEATIRFPNPKAPVIRLNHYTTIQGRVVDALDKARASVACSIAFQNILRWEPFMRMKDHPGHMMSRASGKKLEQVDALPDDYRAIARDQHPKLFADPVATLDRLVDKITR